MSKKNRDKVIFSTDPNFEVNCPSCSMKISACICPEKNQKSSQLPAVEIRRETKGRRGKTVTVISKAGSDIKNTLRTLQKLCGGGGTIKNMSIEIQGDHREKVKLFFEKEGRRVKFTGG